MTTTTNESGRYIKIGRPRYKGTTVCWYCEAEYKKDTTWVIGYHHKGTDLGFTVTGYIPKGVCPVCRREEIIR
jgi:rubrerythrin